jgi:DNA-directed RNA polymerase specialized sigma24 family protein
VKKDLVEPIPKHRILREVYRHYYEFKQLFTKEGIHTIEHSYWTHNDDGSKGKHTVEISLWDLHDGLESLSARKREAVYYNVILDKKQKDVADIMGITTVSVGQYVEQAMMQLAERYFSEEKKEAEDGVA